jgi:hypothetical protein
MFGPTALSAPGTDRLAGFEFKEFGFPSPLGSSAISRLAITRKIIMVNNLDHVIREQRALGLPGCPVPTVAASTMIARFQSDDG